MNVVIRCESGTEPGPLLMLFPLTPEIPDEVCIDFAYFPKVTEAQEEEHLTQGHEAFNNVEPACDSSLASFQSICPCLPTPAHWSLSY